MISVHYIEFVHVLSIEVICLDFMFHISSFTSWLSRKVLVSSVFNLIHVHYFRFVSLFPF